MDEKKQKIKKVQHRELRLLKNVIKPKATEVKKSVCSFFYLVALVKTLCLILFYYCFSIGITFYNQHVIQEYKLPLSFTMAHLVFKFMAAGLIRNILEWYTGEPRVLLAWKQYSKQVALTGIVSALDIGLSNWSFDFITVSLYTMSKSSAVIFVMGFALFFRLEKCRFSQVFVVVFIAVGLFLFTYQSTQFNSEGFLMVMVASALSGLRWTLAQIVLQKAAIGLHNPLDMMYHIQPWMILTLLPMSATAEGLKLSSAKVAFGFTEVNELVLGLSLVTGGAVLAFLLEFSEFLLVSNTSSLTLSIAGIFKELCVLYLAVYVNGDKINAVNGIGMVVCLAGIALHIILKAVYGRQDREQEMVRALNHPEERIEMLTNQNGVSKANTDDEDDEDDIFNIHRDR